MRSLQITILILQLMASGSTIIPHISPLLTIQVKLFLLRLTPSNQFPSGQETKLKLMQVPFHNFLNPPLTTTELTQPKNTNLTSMASFVLKWPQKCNSQPLLQESLPKLSSFLKVPSQEQVPEVFAMSSPSSP